LKEEKNVEKSILKSFFKYVSLSVLGMMGTSFYVLIDTFFISKAEGPLGMAALNFSIPVFCIILGLGLMIGIGGATRYSILKSQKQDREANIVFSTCIKAGIIISAVLVIIGTFGSEFLAGILGADMSTLAMTKAYMSTILCFAPFFIINNISLI
jgi:Na+-driven multidrug efflux pump